MRDLRNFATSLEPLHPSGLAALLQCPWRLAMLYLSEAAGGEGGAAADTGSATHVAVAELHRGKGMAECLEVMRTGLPKYPRADLQDAADLFLKYASDPRNKSAELLFIEEQISFQISPAPEDETQEPIQVIGMVDQVRLVDGVARVYDLKTSKREPTELLQSHTFQAAAYCIGASIRLGRPVEPGALILPRRYRADVATSPVFWHFPWKLRDIEDILRGVRHVVAAIRAGRIWHNPNDNCKWCEMRTPDLCLPKLQQLGLPK